MSGWTIAWLCWGAAFLIIEGVALFNKRTSDTLSEHFWGWLKVSDRRPTPLVWVMRGGVFAFCVWLAFHLAFGWFTPSDPWPF